MSSTKKWAAADLRAEMARRNITRREVAEALGLSYNYVKKILSGERKAELRRKQISYYLRGREEQKSRVGLVENREFHEALGLKAGVA